MPVSELQLTEQKMSEKKTEPQEYPKVRYTGIGVRFVDGVDLLRSKAGQRLLDSAMKMETNSNLKLKSPD